MSKTKVRSSNGQVRVHTGTDGLLARLHRLFSPRLVENAEESDKAVRHPGKKLVVAGLGHGFYATQPVSALFGHNAVLEVP